MLHRTPLALCPQERVFVVFGRFPIRDPRKILLCAIPLCAALAPYFEALPLLARACGHRDSDPTVRALLQKRS